MLKPGVDVLIRAKVLDDGRLLVSPGAVIDSRATDIVGDADAGMGLGERAMLVMYFRSEQERQRFADGLHSGGDRGRSDYAQ